MSPERAQFFQGLETPFMEVLNEGDLGFDEEPGSYPLFVHVLNSSFWKWSPSGKPRRISGECEARSWAETYLAKDFHSFEDEALFLGDQVRKCDSKWQTGWNSPLTNALGAMSMSMEPKKYPFGRQVMFNLPGGVRLKGFLAMKPDGKKRPLVIFRTGIFSVVHEFFPERFFFMQMFDQSPFHVLVVESLSGSDFIRRNQSYSFGGFDEGIQNYLIADELQKSSEPISKHVQGVHLMGMSFGGHGIFFASLLSSLNKRDASVIDSSLAFCPLLNFRETLDFHTSTGFSLNFMNYYVEKRIGVLRERAKDMPEGPFLPSLLTWIEKNYHGPLVSLPATLPGQKAFHLPMMIDEIKKDIPQAEWFWRLNDFWTYYKNIKTPLLVMATEKDPIVPWAINSGRLMTGRMPMAGSEVAFLPLKEGYHCSLNVAYDWSSIASVTQSFVLKHAKKFSMVRHEVRRPVEDADVVRKTQHFDLDFKASVGNSYLIAQIRMDQEFSPPLLDRWMAPTMTVHIPLTETEYSMVDKISTEAESQIIERWAHQNISAKMAESELILFWKVSR